MSAPDTVALLGQHAYEIKHKPLSICACGFWESPDAESGETMQDVHRTHVAAVLDAHYADREQTLRATIRELSAAYREAIGAPPTQHQRERLERMASDLEAARADVADRERAAAEKALRDAADALLTHQLDLSTRPEKWRVEDTGYNAGIQHCSDALRNNYLPTLDRRPDKEADRG